MYDDKAEEVRSVVELTESPAKRYVCRIAKGVNQIELAEAANRRELPQWANESEQHYSWFLYWCANPHLTQQELGAHFGVNHSAVCRVRNKNYWKARVGKWWAARHSESNGEDWEEKQDELRRTEWELHGELVDAAREALERWRKSDKIPNLAEISKIIELASRLGRLASGLPLTHTEVSRTEESPIRINIEAALERAYGGSSSVVDVEVLPPEAKA